MKMTLAAFVTIVFSISFATPSVDAQIVPWRTVGPGSFDVVNNTFGGTAKGKHLGKCTYFGNAVLTPTNDPLVVAWTADDTYVSANGRDKVFLIGEGTTTLIPLGGNMFSAVWDGEWTVVGGEGRFENVGPASEPITMIAINDPFDIVNDATWYFNFIKEGEFDLGRRN